MFHLLPLQSQIKRRKETSVGLICQEILQYLLIGLLQGYKIIFFLLNIFKGSKLWGFLKQ